MNLRESSLSFLSMVFLISCGPNPSRPPVQPLQPRVLAAGENDPRGSNVIESAFIPLVSEFETYWSKTVTTPIYFANDLSANILGVCIVWTRGDLTYKEIKVNRQTFGRDAVESEMIIFHELGHCELGRPHSADLTRLPDGRIIPFSLMYAVLFLSTDYTQFHEHFIRELFGFSPLLPKLGTTPLEDQETVERIYVNGFEGFVYH